MVIDFLLQSFYFNSLQSQYENYCLFVPILPYFVQIQECQNQVLNSLSYCGEIKKQENVHMTMKTIQSCKELERYRDFSIKKGEISNQESIYFPMRESNIQWRQQEKVKIEQKTVKNSTLNQEISQLLDYSKHPSSKQSSTKNKKLKNHKYLTQEQYNPFQKRKRSECKQRQNENRNIIPNQINQIFSYIQKSSKSKFVVTRIFSKYPPIDNRYNIKRFYLYQSLLKQRVSNYINQNSLSLLTELYEPRCEVYSQQEQRYYNKVCRVLIGHFLQEDSIFNILTSRRMHREKKRSHLEMRRVLKDKVIEILKH